ncbi:MAG TPA: hypothetical protein VIL79_03925 [Thermoleophilia bacterium]
MPYLVWNRQRLFYRQAGDPGRPLLVLLPGSTASSANYAAELEHFGRRFQVAAVVADSCVERLTAEDLERVVHERDPATRGGRPPGVCQLLVLPRRGYGRRRAARPQALAPPAALYPLRRRLSRPG